MKECSNILRAAVATVFFLLQQQQQQAPVPFAGSTKLFGLANELHVVNCMKSCGYTTRPFVERQSNVDYEDGVL
jgi:hypothetical protein